MNSIAAIHHNIRLSGRPSRQLRASVALKMTQQASGYFSDAQSVVEEAEEDDGEIENSLSESMKNPSSSLSEEKRKRKSGAKRKRKTEK